MRILMTLFMAQDPGGIAGDLIWKVKGLREAGHHVDLILLDHKDHDPKKRGLTTQEGATMGDGFQAHPRAGFFGIPVISYGSDDRIRKLHKNFQRYDVIIHEIPGPNPVLTHDTNRHWVKLYQHDVPQIISAHDANFQKLYPHLIHIAKYIKGISCTNQAGYKNLEQFPAPRAFIGAPHPVFDWSKQPSWDEREYQAVAASTWKAWKRMDVAVRAAPYLQQTTLIGCGSGIEYYYMTSTSKVKEKYVGIWQDAMDYGFDYRGMVSTPDLDKIYRQSRIMFDPSYSKTFAKLGCHFNRSIIEGYNNGCVPLVVRENMHEKGFQLQMFKEGVTHFAISHDASPEEVAVALDKIANMPKAKADAMVAAGRKVLKRFFDYRVTSLEYLKLAQGKPAGVYPKLECGKPDAKTIAAAKKFLSGIERRIERDREKGKIE